MPLLGAFVVPHPPLIVPEIGRGEETKIQSTVDAYHHVAKSIGELKPQTIVILSPHSPSYSDYFHIGGGAVASGSFKDFRAPEVRFNVTYDESFVHTLETLCKLERIPGGTLGEKNERLDHGVMVPLYFIDQIYKNYRLVKISLSGLSPLVQYRFGKLIGKAIRQSEKKVIAIASGDLSHKLTAEGPYGYAKEGPLFDQQITAAFSRGDFLKILTMDDVLCEEAAECGLGSFQIMTGMFDGMSVVSNLLSYEGPFGVGYAVASFIPSEEDPQRRFDSILISEIKSKMLESRRKEDSYIGLARESLEYFILNGKILAKPKDLPREMNDEQAGVFVSIKKHGRLRGCIGTISPTQKSIAEEIIQNAISAGTEDPRFDAVSEDELSDLVYDVDVLGKPESITSKNELDPKKYGVIVSSGGRRGLLLPDLEGVDTIERQISIALSKAGIDESEKYSLQRFVVTRHE